MGWIDHAALMFARYLDYRGYQQAAAITYFSVLSLVPVLMVVLSVAGYLLAGQPGVLGRLHHDFQAAVPVTVQPLVDELVDNAIDHRFGLGLAGILVAGYSGWNWMNALRDALTGMWQLRRPAAPVVRAVVKDCGALLGLGLAVLLTFAATVVGGDLGYRLLGVTGLGGSQLGPALSTVGSVIVALILQG